MPERRFPPLVLRGNQFGNLSSYALASLSPLAAALPGAAELGAQLALNSVSQRRQRSFEILVIVAGVAEEADKFRKFRQ